MWGEFRVILAVSLLLLTGCTGNTDVIDKPIPDGSDPVNVTTYGTTQSAPIITTENRKVIVSFNNPRDRQNHRIVLIKTGTPSFPFQAESWKSGQLLTIAQVGVASSVTQQPSAASSQENAQSIAVRVLPGISFNLQASLPPWPPPENTDCTLTVESKVVANKTVRATITLGKRSKSVQGNPRSPSFYGVLQHSVEKLGIKRCVNTEGFELLSQMMKNNKKFASDLQNALRTQTRLASAAQPVPLIPISDGSIDLLGIGCSIVTFCWWWFCFFLGILCWLLGY